jgi:regulator of nucleoside diphosphate kinase
MLPFPPVRLLSCDWARLMHLAFDAKYDRHPVAPFLRAEVHRAIVSEEDNGDGDVVRLNTWVTYHVDWDAPESRLLVHPDDVVADSVHLSVLTSLGAALLGIRVGDRMPFVGADGRPHLATVLSVRHDPTMLRLFRCGSMA